MSSTVKQIHAAIRDDVAGPYTPIDARVADATDVIEVARAYWSHLVWGRQERQIVRSMRHTAVMMGEIDEDDEDDNHYDPLESAAQAGLYYVFERLANVPLYRAHPGHRDLEKWEVNNVTGTVVQLLFALLQDDAGLASVAHQWRTGYVGKPSETDVANASKIRDYVRELTRRADEFIEAMRLARYEIPLMSPYSYDLSVSRHYWSAPIERPVFECEEN